MRGLIKGPLGPRTGLCVLVLLVLACLIFPARMNSERHQPATSAVPLSYPVLAKLPEPQDEVEAELLEGLSRNRVVPFRATRGSGGLDGTAIRPGDSLTRSQTFAMFMDDVSSIVRKTWTTLALPQISKALAVAEELKANAADPEEGEKVALQEKARVFARLMQVVRFLINEVSQHYKTLQSKSFFRYFTEHVYSAIEFSLLFSLKLMAHPATPVGPLAYLADDAKEDIGDGLDLDPQILMPDGKLVPVSPEMLHRALAAVAANQPIPNFVESSRVEKGVSAKLP